MAVAEIVVALALLLVLLVCLACVRGSEVTRGANERLASGRWSVNGIEIGMARAEVEAILGPGEQVGFSEHLPTFRYGARGISVRFDSDARVARVSGDTLARDGERVLRVGQGNDEIPLALGVGFVVERFTPTTSGIFVNGSVPGSIEHYYDDGHTRFQIFVSRDGDIGGIHSAPIGGLPIGGFEIPER
jgi:hypothetical protein